VNQEELKLFKALVSASVRKQLSRVDSKSSALSVEKAIQVVSATAGLLSALLAVGNPSPNGTTDQKGSGPPISIAQQAKNLQKEVDHQASLSATPAAQTSPLGAWPRSTVMEQRQLSRELLDRLRSIDIGSIPANDLFVYVAQFPPAFAPEEPKSGTAGFDMSALTSLMTLAVTQSSLAMQAATDAKRNETSTPCCQTSNTHETPSAGEPPKPSQPVYPCCTSQPASGDSGKSAEKAAESAESAAKSAKAAQDALEAVKKEETDAVPNLRKAAVGGPITVSFRVPIDGSSECKAIPDFSVPAAKQMTVQFRAMIRSKSTVVDLVDCSTGNKVSEATFPDSRSSEKLETGVKGRYLMAELISLESTGRILGFGRRTVAIVLSAWLD
jgi:hypothetical protein